MSFDSFSSGKKFYDDKHFPYGFQRSGHFTYNEADCLTNYGYKMHQLDEKLISPEDETHKHLLAVLEGTAQPENDAEKVYLKYKQIVYKKNHFISTVVKINNFDSASNNDDMDDDMDDMDEEQA